MPPLPPSSTSSSSDDFPYPQPHTPPEYSCSSIHIPIQHKGIMAGYHHHEGEEEEVRGRNSYSLERFLQEPGSPSTTGGGAGGGAGVNGKYGTMSPGSSIQGYTGLTGNGRRPRLLLMGQRRSGKSSISSVVFHKMPPTETLFLESTTRIQKDPIHSFMDFQVWDFPGQLNFLDPTFDFDHIFGELGALIWVIDAQDEYLDPLSRLHATIIAIQRSYPAINIEVFIHKVDGLSDEYKLDTQRDIMQRTQDELSDNGLDNVQVSYHLTSIYDHSVFEAFSKVIQKLIPQLETLENLLNVLCSNSGIEKAFLFDVLSKIYIATDSSPVDVQSYEICSDYIDVIVDVSEIYGYDRKQPAEITDAPHVVPGAEDDEEQTAEASSIIRLQNGMVLYLREINKYLALICLMRKEGIEKKGLVDFNVQVFQNALQRVFEVGR